MKVLILENLKTILLEMDKIFGRRAQAEINQKNIKYYVLNVNPDDNKDATLAKLGTGRLGRMVLGRATTTEEN